MFPKTKKNIEGQEPKTKPLIAQTEGFLLPPAIRV